MQNGVSLVVRSVLACAAAALLTLSVACTKSESVPVGGECSSRDDCQKRNDCMQLAPGKKVCTQTCMTFPKDDCPAPTTCQKVDMSMDTNGGKTVSATGINYCLPK
jgi:hypothetical protein